MPLFRPLACVFVLAVLVRLSAQVLLGAYVHPATWEYEAIANNLLAGRGYTYASGGITYVAAVSSPLYVVLTAGVYLMTGHSQAAMLVVQAVFGGLTAALAGWLGARVFQPESAWAAGGLVAVDPALAVYAAGLHPLSLDALAFLGVVCACVGLPARPGWRRLGLVGALMGIAALTRTTVLSFAPVLVWWVNRFRGVKLLSVPSLALVAAAVLIYAPWPVRNSLLLEQFVAGSSESTEWLWRGMNPAATGASYTADGSTMLQAAPPAFQAEIASASESERIDIYRRAAVDYASQHPAQAARLYLLKLKSFWLGSDSTGLEYPAVWTLLYDGWYALMLLLAGAGLVWGWREPSARPAIGLILISLGLVSASQAFFYVEGRHRLAVEPLLLVLSGVGLSRLVLAAGLAGVGVQRFRGVKNTLS